MDGINFVCYFPEFDWYLPTNYTFDNEGHQFLENYPVA